MRSNYASLVAFTIPMPHHAPRPAALHKSALVTSALTKSGTALLITKSVIPRDSTWPQRRQSAEAMLNRLLLLLERWRQHCANASRKRKRLHKSERHSPPSPN